MLNLISREKSGLFGFAGFAIGLLILVAVYDYQSSIHTITFSGFFEQSPTQNLLLVLIVAIPGIGGILVGQARMQLKQAKRQAYILFQERQKLIDAQKRIKHKSSKLQGLLDQESGFFVDNWDQLVTEKDKLREEVEVSSALLDVALSIGNLAKPNEVLSILAEVLPSALFADDCLLFTWDPSKKTFISNEHNVKLNTRSMPALKHLKEKMVPITIEDAAAGNLISKKITDRFAVKSAILIPCVNHNKVKAVAMVVYTKATHEFTDRDIQIASGIVNPAKIVLENADLYAEIVASHNELQRLMTRLAESQEEERRRIARDLHDGVIQNLSGIIFSLSFLTKALDKKEDSAIQEIEQIENIVEETISDLRQVIYDLRPTILDSLGLAPTLEKHIEKFSAMNNIKVGLNAQLSGRLPGPVETALFRLAQETFNNIKKHADAKTIALDLKKTKKNVIMTVKDDGKGFDIEEVGKRVSQTGGFGLSGMRERVQSLNGQVKISSKLGEGTLVKVTIPLTAKGA